jgi:16S rRNA processing protein RimM
MIYSKKKIINIGCIVKTHGVQGELVLRLSPGYNSSLLNKVKWCFINIRQKPVPFKILEASEGSTSDVILELQDIQNKPEAEKYLNYDISIERETAIRKGKTENINLLLGYQIYNNGNLIGTIEDIENTGKQFLFVLNDGTLLPAHDDLIEKIEDRKKIVFMQLPEGLI